MSWITGEAASREDLLDLCPGLAEKHRAVAAAIWMGSVPIKTLEYCRLRMARILGAQTALAEPSHAAVDPEAIAVLSAWPSNPHFDEVDRACIALAEQYVIDIHGVTDSMIENLTELIGPEGVVTLTTALAMWELTHRFDNALLHDQARLAPAEGAAR